MRYALVLLLLSPLSPLLFAQPSNVEGFFLADWKFYAVLSAFISILAAVLLLLVSRALDLRQWETTFKGELVFAGSTVFLVMLLVAFIEVGEPQMVEVSKGMLAAAYSTPTQTINPNDIRFSNPDIKLIDVAQKYMEPIGGCVQDFMRLLYIGNLPAEAHSTMYQEMFMSEQATGGGSKPLVELMKTYTKSLTFYMLAYYILIHSLNFIKYYALFFLSIGVVLRSFPPTRGAGAYLLALSIGLYFIFPFTFMFMSTLAATPMKGLVEYHAAGPPAEQFVCNMPIFPESEVCGAQQRSQLFLHRTWLDAFSEEFHNTVNTFSGKIFQQLTTTVCLLPLVAMVVVLTFVINVTNLFGGSIPEIGRGLVKLI